LNILAVIRELAKGLLVLEIASLLLLLLLCLDDAAAVLRSHAEDVAMMEKKRRATMVKQQVSKRPVVFLPNLIRGQMLPSRFVVVG